MASEKPLLFRTQSRASRKLHKTRSDDGLITLRYEEALAAKRPIPVTVPPPRAPPTDIHPALRRQRSALTEEDLSKRDSGLAPTTSSKARDSSVTIVDENGLSMSIDFMSGFTTALPSPTPVSSAPEPGESRRATDKTQLRKNSGPKTPIHQVTISPPLENQYTPIKTDIPTDSLLDSDFLEQISFTQRGSMLLGGEKAVKATQPSNEVGVDAKVEKALPGINVLSDNLELESQKVRSMYELDSDFDLQQSQTYSSFGDNLEISEGILEEGPNPPYGGLSPINGLPSRSETAFSIRSEGGTRRPHELAGGIEDWEDIDGKDVDRYGFISMNRSFSRPGTPEPRPPQRTSTLLQLASETPRRKGTFSRSPSSATSRVGLKRGARKTGPRSLQTQDTRGSAASERSNRSHIRSAANRLPGNRDRRLMDEAGDMLTLPPGLADIAEDEEGGRAAEGLKMKEWERAEKWRKMAKVVKAGKNGEGMEFEFDARNPKLIERTWKGIPDRWRGAAWYSFMRTSANKRKDLATEDGIIAAFHKFQHQSSADDVQIDIDVPRTINSHIMFRKRYRGGQRLLFRVLHALSLYFPETGYVQGMASLAATFLCYFDEERAFVMLVRMWTLRGLDKLYEAGFPGLMAALDELENQWLKGGEVTKKLTELNIEATSYGTRWYLTLFNYSIPFPAQLRVWDVFILLGDSDANVAPSKERPFAGGLDVLHATSAALIDGTRDILLDSDFENAMKVLTSWIPVKDEELLMKVAKAEWKLHRGKKPS